MNPETDPSPDLSGEHAPFMPDLSTDPLTPIPADRPLPAADPALPAADSVPAAGPPFESLATPRRGARIRARTAAVGALVVVVALVATTVWSLSVKADVDRTFAEATSTRQATADSAAKVQQARSDLTGEQSAVALANDVNAKLERQIENQAICASAQQADLASLQKVFDDSRANFENATKGSKLFAAYAANKKAFDAAVTDLVKAYRAAAAGSLTAANNWVRASNTQVSIAIKQARILDKEIDKVNATTDRITGAQKALDARLDATAVTCGG
jgi:hypothetical protein